MAPLRTSGRGSQFVLIIGFGGLLALLALAGYGGLDALRQIQSTNDKAREEFLRRTRVLDRIRGDLYVSGTYVRDYLLEREAGKADGHRYSLLEARKDMDSALDEYRSLLSSRETAPFQALGESLASYWNALEPVMKWSRAQRQNDGYVFLRDEVFPRRTAMLGIANQIGVINEQQLDEAKDAVERTFAQFRERLTAAAALSIGLGFVLAGFSIMRILGLEQEAARRYTEIAKAREDLQALSARLVQAQEDERRSIARELHDEIGQSLTGVLVEMANLSNLLRSGDAEGAGVKAEEAKKLMENSIAVVRNMALLLRPSMLDDLGLVPALQWQAREVAKRSGMSVRVFADGVSEDLPDEHKTAVYRIAQEALNNAVKHSQSRRIKIAVRQRADQLSLSVEDDGKGFDARSERGMGLMGIEERVKQLGGAIEVDSDARRGTALRVVFPLRRAAPEEEEGK